MGAIASYFKITAPSATSLVNELVKAELVLRAHSEHDRREVLLHLSSKGKAVLYDFEGKRKKIFDSVFAVLSEKDREQFDAILNKILAGSETK